MGIGRTMMLLMNCLCKSGTAGLAPFILTTFLCLKVGEEAEHLDLDLAEFGLGVNENSDDEGDDDKCDDDEDIDDDKREDDEDSDDEGDDDEDSDDEVMAMSKSGEKAEQLN